MPPGFTFTFKPTFRDVQGRFARAERALLEERREGVRRLGQRYVALVGEEARGGPGHTIAKQVSFETFNTGEVVGFRTRLGPIARWHVSGTGLFGPRNRLIRPVQAKALRFNVGGKTIFRRWVRGVKPDKYLQRAYKRWLPGAKPELKRVATRFTKEFAAR